MFFSVWREFSWYKYFNNLIIIFAFWQLEPSIEQFLSEWKALGSPSDPDVRECYRRFLKLLYRRKDFKRLIQEAVLMTEFFPTDPYPREWLCKVYAELHIEGNALSSIDLSDIDSVLPTQVDHLLKTNANSKVVLLAQAVNHYLSGQIVVARDELLRGEWDSFELKVMKTDSSEEKKKFE